MVATLQYLRFCLFEMSVNVGVFIRCLYSAVSLTLVREQHFIRIYYYYYYQLHLRLQFQPIHSERVAQRLTVVLLRLFFLFSPHVSDIRLILQISR